MTALTRVCVWLSVFLFASTAALAQMYPNKAVRMVVPFPAGGSTDMVGRTVAQKLSEMWGHPVVVDNRAGGGTVIGTDVVAKAAPDGYTLLVTPAPFSINPSLLAKLPYNALADFAPITLINTTPLVLVVNPGGSITMSSLTFTLPGSLTRPTSFLPRSTSMMCSARSFGSARSSSARDRSSSSVAPRRRVPAMGRRSILPPSSLTITSGEAPTTVVSPQRRKYM